MFFLQDIQSSIVKIFRYTDNIDYAKFFADEMIKDAVIRNFEIIGEAVKNLSEDFRNKYESIPFKKIAGMRDR